MTLQQAIAAARKRSLENPGCSVHINASLLRANLLSFEYLSVSVDPNGFYASDWFGDSTVMTICDDEPR